MELAPNPRFSGGS